MSDHQWLTTSAGVKMPFIIYGTAWKKQRTADLVMQAVQTGFRGIDTACQPKHYNEPQVGIALRKLQQQRITRDALYLQTKFTPLAGQDPNNVPYDISATIDIQVAQSFESSLENLQTDYVDCLLLHSPLSTHELLMQAWCAMESIQKSSGAHQLGISNCYELEVLKMLYTDATVKPAILQNRFYKETGYDAELRQWCRQHGIIYQSFWSLTANPHILASESVQALAGKYGKTEAQVFFRYLGLAGIVPLTGTCSMQHMKEDLDLFDFSLKADEMLLLNSLLF